MAKKKINPLEIEQKIVAVEYSDEMQSSYIDYAMSVIAGRALPDARDGLKPVHRRILYSMKELNLSPDSTYRKSARVVGDVLGKYHPHGDSAVYQAMVRMAQPFSLRNTLVDGHGNFGSIDGDGAAAMRYTEARLTHLSQELLKDSDKGIVEFKYNFDETLKEPCVLPARFPNLLVNGSSGIAVGMSTNIPSHNLRETIKATIAFMKDRDITYKKLMSYLKGPDFPTGGIIVNKDDLQSIYETGKGSIKIRANTKIEPLKNGKFNIVITEVPYTFSGSVEKFILKIVDLVKEKKVDELVDIRDESNREGLRIVLETKKGVNPELLLNKLYKISHLQDSFAADFIALVKNDYLCSTNEFIPKRLSLKMLLSEFISFQEELVSKKAKFELQKSMDRLEIVQGLVKAIDIIDTIIEVIRGSESDKDAKNCLMTGDITNIEFKTKASAKRASLLKFTDRQAEAILNMRLRKLSGLEINELVAEENSLIADIEKNKRVLEDENERFKIIEEYLLEISDNYGDKRRTKIDNLTIDEAALKESKKVDDLTILLDKNGYIKSVDTNSLSRVSQKELDEFETVINTNTEDKLCMFTSLNKLHQLKVKDVPVGKIKDKGVPLDTIIPLEMCKETQTIAIEEILYMNSFENIADSYICMITKNGLCKFIDTQEYSSFRSESKATKIVEGDELKIVTILYKKEYDESSLVIFNQDTMVFKIKTRDIKIDKKGNKGNEILELGKKDVIIAGYIINEKEDSSVEILTQETTYVINLNKIKLQKLKSKAKKLTGVPKSEIISISMKKSDEGL